MASVVSSHLKSREGSFHVENKSNRRYTYVVTTNDKATEGEVFLGSMTAAPHPVPALYTYLGGSAYVTSIEVAQHAVDNFTKWNVTVVGGELPSGSEPGNGDPGTINDNPLYRKAVKWFETMTETVVIEKDASGEPILNSAGQEYDTPLTDDVDMLVAVIRKNYANLSTMVGIQKDYENKINSDAIEGFDIGTLKFLSIDASEPQFENETRFYTGTVRLLHRKQGWTRQILSTGFHELVEVGGNNRLRRITSGADNMPISEPARLDADGKALAEDAAPSASHYTSHTIYNSISFATLFSDPVVP